MPSTKPRTKPKPKAKPKPKPKKIHPRTSAGSYSALTESFEKLRKQAEYRALLSPVEPFTPEEMTPLATKLRVQRALTDYCFFDEKYFSNDQYQNHAKSGDYHRRIYDEIMRPGVTVHAGPRDFGKTVTAKKIHVWLLLTGRTKMLAIVSGTLTNAENIMHDIAELILDNDRIMHDFMPEFLQANAKQFAFRVTSEYVEDKKERRAACFSEERSIRGFMRKFTRPDRIYVDDLETSVSALGGDHTRSRIAMLEEAYGSLTGTGTMFCVGNNFDARGYINVLLLEKEKGGLGDKETWQIEIYAAITDGVSLWFEKFPATTEAEMMVLVKARNRASFNANWQQKPTPPEGHVFKRTNLQFWTAYPKDCRGVIYADQNLALKSKGDTTAIVRITFSPSTGYFYISARCLSFADPNDFLNAVLAMKNARVRGIGFDGNVSQESHWRMHIRAWCRENKSPYPQVQFCKYVVDQLATNFQMVFAEGKVFFDPAMQFSEEGAEFFDQFFAFVSKKKARTDDAPDASICAYQLITERRLNRIGSSSTSSNQYFDDEE